MSARRFLPGLGVLALFGASGCAQVEGVQTIREARLRWEGRDAGGWTTVQAPRYVDTPDGAQLAVIEWQLPANVKPGLNLGFVPRREFRAQLDDQAPFDLDAAWWLLPLPADGLPHRLTVWAKPHRFVSVDALPYGPGATTLFVQLRDEVPRLVAASALLVLGLALVVLSFRARTPAPPRAIAGLALCLAFIDFGEVDVANVFAGLPVFAWFGLHELAMLLPAVCIPAFIRATLGDTRHRLLLWLSRFSLALAAVEVVLWLRGSMFAASLRELAFGLVLAALVLSGVVAWRAWREGSRLARPVLVGLGLILLSVPPGMLEAVGLISGTNFNVSRWGVLGFLGSLGYALLVADRDRSDALRARVAELERSRGEVEALNTELRRQVADKSRALAVSMEGSVPAASKLPVVGELFDDRYLVMRVIGKGGMGAVFEVRRLSDKKPFALKLMTGALGAEHASRFMREADIAARIQHPNLVGVIDVGSNVSGTLFLVMELVVGWSLDRLEERWKERPWSLSVLLQVARGMRALHDEGVVHRDLKPANVVVSQSAAGQPEVKLTDFGIAHQSSAAHPLEATLPPGASDAAKLTRAGDTMGTPRYLAPDQVGAAHTTTLSADAFSFGVMASELLCGTYPFVIPPALEVMAGRTPQEADTAFLAKSGLPPRLRGLLVRCLSLAPAERPSATELIEALEEALEQSARSP